MQLPLKASWPLQKVVPFWGPPKTCRFQLTPRGRCSFACPSWCRRIPYSRCGAGATCWRWHRLSSKMGLSFFGPIFAPENRRLFCPQFPHFSAFFSFNATKTTKRPSLVDSGPGLPAPWQISLNLTRSTWIRNPQLASHLSWHSGPPSPGPRVVSEV